MTEEERLAVVAWLYYKEGLTQEGIARRLGLSRVKVARLLARARERGVVEFRITRPLPESFRLARALETAYRLAEAVVAPGGEDREAALRAVGQAAAETLLRVVGPGDALGVGWSTTLHRMNPYLHPPGRPLGGRVHELVGSFLGQANPYSVSARVAEALGCRLVPLPAPVLVERAGVARALLREPGIAAALEGARSVRVAFVGIGLLDRRGTLVQTGMLRLEEAEGLIRLGAVGDVLMRFFDREGKPLATPLDDRVIGIDWDAFLAIPYRVAVAVGVEKAPVIRAALAGGLVHALVTDAATARALLEGGTPLGST